MAELIIVVSWEVGNHDSQAVRQDLVLGDPLPIFADLADDRSHEIRPRMPQFQPTV